MDRLTRAAFSNEAPSARLCAETLRIALAHVASLNAELTRLRATAGAVGRRRNPLGVH
ncbi:MAG: hypothetical protein U5L06_05880 [Rhodovibrio sp.]|nr:hypothetical protein [Rhodovibrio sp.]